MAPLANSAWIARMLAIAAPQAPAAGTVGGGVSGMGRAAIGCEPGREAAGGGSFGLVSAHKTMLAPSPSTTSATTIGRRRRVVIRSDVGPPGGRLEVVSTQAEDDSPLVHPAVAASVEVDLPPRDAGGAHRAADDVAAAAGLLAVDERGARRGVHVQPGGRDLDLVAEPELG